MITRKSPQPGILVLAVISLILSLLPLSAVHAKTALTVTDLAGREVRLEVPAETVVLAGWSGSGNPFYTLFGLLGDQTPRTIVGMDAGLKNHRAWIWKKFTERYPALDSIADIGTPPEINIEKIIELNPDVVLVPASAAKPHLEVFDKIQQAGIPVVMNDYHTETLETHARSIELIGTILGKPQRAREMIDFYRQQVGLVESRLAQADGPKPSVYIEVGTKPMEYSNTYGNSMWGVLVPRAGGENIAAGLVETYAPISAEAVLKANPEIIILTGSNWPKREGSVRLGYYAQVEETRETLNNFLSRPGWAQLDAVKNGRVYAIHHGLAREVWDFYAIQVFATWFHPELFADLDPEQNFRQFHEQFLGLELSGTWHAELR